MSFTRKKTADLDTSSTVKAVKRARTASSAAAANAATAAQNAALATQNAAGVAQTAAQNAAVIATNAAQNASDAAQTAAAGLSTAATGLTKEVKEGVYTARSWAAPRLESAAEYCTTTVAPKVSSALRTTARQVSPVDTTSSKRRSIVTWSVLGASVLAALGAAAALVRYRYRAAIAAETETADDEVLADSSDSQPGPSSLDGDRPKAEKPAEESSVNGRVSAPGR
jgi:trimeric autotransporter adhesin